MVRRSVDTWCLVDVSTRKVAIFNAFNAQTHADFICALVCVYVPPTRWVCSCMCACDGALISSRRCETIQMVSSTKHWAIFCCGRRLREYGSPQSEWEKTNLNYLCIHLIESWINAVASKLKIIKFIQQPQNKNNNFIPLTRSWDQIAHENNAQCQWNFARVFTECTSIFAGKLHSSLRRYASRSLFLVFSLSLHRLLLFKSSCVSRCLASFAHFQELHTNAFQPENREKSTTYMCVHVSKCTRNGITSAKENGNMENKSTVGNLHWTSAECKVNAMQREKRWRGEKTLWEI